MMKIGCTYLYPIFRYGYPPSFEDDLKALEDYKAMGFTYLELEGMGTDHLKRVHKNRKVYKQRCDGLGLKVHNFCPVLRDLVSMGRDKRESAYEAFRYGVEVAAEYGVHTVHLASYTPDVTFSGPRPYAGSKYAFDEDYRVRFDPAFDWEAQWDVLVESVGRCCDMVKEIGKKVIMEPRVGEIICSSDSLLRLIKDVGRDNFYANFDCAHFQAQKEILPITLMKLRGKFANIHIADNDGTSSAHLPLGRGNIDWEAFFEGLVLMRYDAYLGVDIGDTPNVVEDLKASARFILNMADRMGFACQM